jgi:hypothetical protein
MKYKLSICLPAHRTQLWEQLYDSAAQAVGPNYEWEMICVGPKEPPGRLGRATNFKFYKDFGTPSRCAQISTMLAEGELMVGAVDDGIFTPRSLQQCIELHDTIPEKDVVATRYTEGRNYAGKPMHPDYWMAHHHPTLRVVPADYKLILLGMFKLSYFREVGGWDCAYEHLNMNYHDLAFRIQKDGGKIHMSPEVVINCNWNPNEGDHVPVQQAYDQNDLELFNKMYAPDADREVKIDYYNWTKSPAVWERRFGKME